MKKFVGKIKQTPPVKSSVKRQEREREIYYWDLLEYNKNRKIALFKTKVEKGTYIRKLISDMGDNIGGAHMLELRRSDAGIFSENDKGFINLYDLDKIKDDENKLKEAIIPGEAIGKILKTINIKGKSKRQLLTGKPVFKKDIKSFEKMKTGENIAVFCKNQFIEVVEVINEGEVIAKPKFVFN